MTNFSLHLMPKMQVAEQKTDRLINSTRQILENIYKQAFLTNSNWPVGVLSKKCPNSICLNLISNPGRKETSWLFWVCYWPNFFWEHGERHSCILDSTLNNPLYKKVENMFHVSFLVKQRVVCLTVFIMICLYKCIQYDQIYLYKRLRTSPSGWWERGPTLLRASVRWRMTMLTMRTMRTTLTTILSFPGERCGGKGGGCQEPGGHLYLLPGTPCLSYS